MSALSNIVIAAGAISLASFLVVSSSVSVAAAQTDTEEWGFASFSLWAGGQSDGGWCAGISVGPQYEAKGYSPPGDWCGGGETQWCCVPNSCMTNDLQVQVGCCGEGTELGLEKRKQQQRERGYRTTE